MHRRCQDKIRIPVFPENKKPARTSCGRGTERRKTKRTPAPETMRAHGFLPERAVRVAQKTHTGQGVLQEKEKRRCRAGSRTKRTVSVKSGTGAGKQGRPMGQRKGEKTRKKAGTTSAVRNGRTVTVYFGYRVLFYALRRNIRRAGHAPRRRGCRRQFPDGD